jgi:hypothetical protein
MTKVVGRVLLFKYEKNWIDVYDNQNTILKTLSSVDDIFLAGGTAVQRFLIERPSRESDDLEFSVSFSKKEVLEGAYHNIANTLRGNQYTETSKGYKFTSSNDETLNFNTDITNSKPNQLSFTAKKVTKKLSKVWK